MISTCAISSK